MPRARKVVMKRKHADIKVKLEPCAGAAAVAFSSVSSSRSKVGTSAGSGSDASVGPPPAKRRRCIRDEAKATVKVEMKKKKEKGKGKGKVEAGKEEEIYNDGGEEELMFDLASGKIGKLLGPPRFVARGQRCWDGVSRWLHFSRCREFARSLKLSSRKEWRAWSEKGHRPSDIPSDPYKVYEESGWTNWGDFLGTGNKGYNGGSFKTFDEARAFARGLKLSGVEAWRAWSKKGHRPSDIPSHPDEAYRESGWINWGDFLGTGNKRGGRERSFKTFDEARAFARGLKLSGVEAWKAWSKKGHRPSDIPSDPYKVYEESGWTNWGDFLGTGNKGYNGGSFKTFDEARAFARGLKLSGVEAWRAWRKKGHRPSDIPSHPDEAYRESGWINWGDFLGTGNKRGGRERSFKTFDEARAFARGLKLSGVEAWRAWSKKGHRPSDIPSDPYKAYKKSGWTNWGDFLGTGNKGYNGGSFKTFDEARAFARGLKLSGNKEWQAWSKKGHRPSDIPSHPDEAYRESGWINWGDFLGTGNKRGGRERSFKTFDEARAFARGLKLSGVEAWRAWSKKGHRPSDIPSDPYKAYKESGWTNWGDFLGTGNKRGGRERSFKTFDEARAFARGLKLSGVEAWRAWRKKGHRPSDIPSHPDEAYEESGWTNWGDFLDTGNKRGGSKRNTTTTKRE